MIRLQLPADLTKSLLNEEQSNSQMPTFGLQKPKPKHDKLFGQNNTPHNYNDRLNGIN